MLWTKSSRKHNFFFNRAQVNCDRFQTALVIFLVYKRSNVIIILYYSDLVSIVVVAVVVDPSMGLLVAIERALILRSRQLECAPLAVQHMELQTIVVIFRWYIVQCVRVCVGIRRLYSL